MVMRVRPISRSLGLSFDAAAALRRVFYGLGGAFLMVPFDMNAPDLHKWEDGIGIKHAEAVKAARLRRVVLLSGISVRTSSLAAVQCSYEDARKGILTMGVSPSFAEAVMQTPRSFNEGDVWAKEKRSDHNTTLTTLEQFARYAFQTYR